MLAGSQIGRRPAGAHTRTALRSGRQLLALSTENHASQTERHGGWSEGL